MVRWRIVGLGTLLAISIAGNVLLALRLLQVPAAPPPAAGAALACTPGAAAAPAETADPAPARLLAQCQERLAQLDRERAAVPAPPPARRAEVASGTPPADGRKESTGAGESKAAASNPSGDPSFQFDEERLRQAGLDEREIARLRGHAERMQAASDSARQNLMRDGKVMVWPGSAAQKALSQQLWAELRRDYGDETYDQMLYATHQPNRARIASVLQGSPGEAAGLRTGDLVLSYDRNRVFDAAELQRTVRSPRNPGTVLVEVERDQQRVEIYVPPGLMGVQVDAASLPPPR